MKALISENGAPAEFLTLEFYGKEQLTEDNTAPNSLASLLLALNPASAASGRADVRMDALSDLKAQAQELNPLVGFYDPLNLAEAEFWGGSNAATIGWLR